jgi:hypothetical protein
MKRILYGVLLLSVHLIADSQTDTIPDLKNVQLDLLITPTNPAFSIMSASPAEIVEPSTSSEFYFSVQNVSNNFTSFPNNYGFTVTPYWWTKAAKTLSFDKDYRTSQKAYFWRYLRISAGVVKGTSDNEKMWHYGLGMQTSILPGKVDKNKKAEYYNSLKSYHNKYYKSVQDYINQDPLFVQLETEQKKLLTSISASTRNDTSLMVEYRKVSTQKDLVQALLAAQYEMLNKFGRDSLDVNKAFSYLEKRIGFKWDIAGGVACKVPNNKIDSANIVRAGFWTNFGWTLPVAKSGNYFDIMGLASFLSLQDFGYMSESGYFYENYLKVIDFGTQIKFDYTNRFSILLEAIYRMPIDDNRVVNSYKINSLIQYKFNKNLLLFGSFGNAFNEKSDQGPQDFQFNIGMNIGLGQKVNINF